MPRKKLTQPSDKKLIQKIRTAFENEIQKEFAGATLEEQGFYAYRLVEGELLA